MAAKKGPRSETTWRDVANTNSRQFWNAVFKLIDKGRFVTVLAMLVLAMFFVWGTILVAKYPADGLPDLAAGVATRLAGSWSVIAFVISLACNFLFAFAYRGMRDTMRVELDRVCEEKRALQGALVPALLANDSTSRRER
jgi:hypothetical protein